MNFNQINSLETLEEYCNSKNCPGCEFDKDCSEICKTPSKLDLHERLLPIVIKKQRKEKLGKLLGK